MSKEAGKKILGGKGEQLACDTLMQKGFAILHRNWRWQHLEVDIIAEKNEVLHFIEVKSQTGTDFGLPEFRVRGKKMGYLKRAAAEFLFQHPRYKHIQFDIVSIVFDSAGGVQDLLVIEDAV